MHIFHPILLKAVPIFEFPVSGWENHMKLLRVIIIFMAVLRIIKQ
mgnify:CR=1 FL=1